MHDFSPRERCNYFDLQRVRGASKNVHTRQQDDVVPAIPLGFKQLARRLHAGIAAGSLLAAKGCIGLGLRKRRLSGRVQHSTASKWSNPGELS
jgi:hypothetical protein